ncbi:YesL family protein [Sporosarcina sp. ANT_H38]|uniref:YesL family protein n=2 Tax=Sporosarcina sp. ANT_H38 TaxID=2597358 RepID=UPI003982ADF3
MLLYGVRKLRYIIQRMRKMNLFRIDGTFYRILEKSINFLLLNLLWFLMCLPIITIFPATAAMFGVVRQWTQKKETGIFRNYFVLLKENFLQSFILGIIWFGLAYLFYFNISISLQMSGTLKFLAVSILVCLCLLFIMTSIFLFPIMVHYKMGWTSILKNSLLFSVTQLRSTFLCGIILFITIVITYIIPMTSIIFWSIAVYNIYRLCDKSFIKIESMGQSV